MESTEKSNDFQRYNNGETYSKSFRTKKRSYFFDVKTNRSDDVFVTITESKRVQSQDGKYNNIRFTIFLYKEDFENFMLNLQDVLGYAKSRISSLADDTTDFQDPVDKGRFPDIEFEDLEGVELTGDRAPVEE